MQPHGGGEVQFVFAYGSEQFDLQCEPTVFRGVICDVCAAKYVNKMERVTQSPERSHHGQTQQIISAAIYKHLGGLGGSPGRYL